MNERPPLPPTCQGDEPWVNPWTDETVYDSIGASRGSLWVLATLLTIAATSVAVCFALIAFGGWA